MSRITHIRKLNRAIRGPVSFGQGLSTSTSAAAAIALAGSKCGEPINIRIGGGTTTVKSMGNMCIKVTGRYLKRKLPKMFICYASGPSVAASGVTSICSYVNGTYSEYKQYIE